MVPWPPSTSLSQTSCPCEACRRRRSTEPIRSTSNNCNQCSAFSNPQEQYRNEEDDSFRCSYRNNTPSKTQQQYGKREEKPISYSHSQDIALGKAQQNPGSREANIISNNYDRDITQNSPGFREANITSNSYDRDKTFGKSEQHYGNEEAATTSNSYKRDPTFSKAHETYGSRQVNRASYSYDKEATLSKAQETYGNRQVLVNRTSYSYDQDPTFSKAQQIYGNRDTNNCINQTNSFGIFSFLKDAIRVLIYFSFLTLCLSIMLICYAAKLGYRLYNSENRLQILGIAALAIIAFFVVFFVTSTGNNQSKCCLAMKASQNYPKKSVECPFKSGKHKSNAVYNGKRITAGESVRSSDNLYFWSKWKNYYPVKSGPVVLKGQKDKARKIMRQHKLYSIPLEMKRPPQLLVFLADYFLR